MYGVGWGKSKRLYQMLTYHHYLVGTLDRFNNGKRAEEADRVKHSVGHSIECAVMYEEATASNYMGRKLAS